jgi:hypothetical protein
MQQTKDKKWQVLSFVGCYTFGGAKQCNFDTL